MQISLRIWDPCAALYKDMLVPSGLVYSQIHVASSLSFCRASTLEGIRHDAIKHCIRCIGSIGVYWSISSVVQRHPMHVYITCVVQ